MHRMHVVPGRGGRMARALYEMTGELLQLMELLYDEEVDEEQLLQICKDIELEIEDKADGYAKIIKDMDGAIDALDAEEKRLKKRRKALEERQTFLKRNLELSMKAIGKTKFKTALFSFGIQKNPASVVVADTAAFIQQCQKDGRDDLLKFTDPEINKTALKEAMQKDGEYFEGVELIQTESLRIR